jgi:DNA-binding IclR family transcriptional regulator
MVQDTSVESYRKLQEVLGEKQRVMLEFFREHPGLKFSNRHLANNLGWPINSVTPRCKELRELGYVVDAGRIFDVTTQRSVLTWKLKR